MQKFLFRVKTFANSNLCLINSYDLIYKNHKTLIKNIIKLYSTLNILLYIILNYNSDYNLCILLYMIKRFNNLGNDYSFLFDAHRVRHDVFGRTELMKG